jgi:ribosomal protein S18 acetylase RimI-like enzyme
VVEQESNVHTDDVDGIRVELGDGSRLAELRPLWEALRRHHQAVASYEPLVADEELSWERRVRRYRETLASGEGILAVALAAEAVVGYAFVLVHRGADDTFEFVGDGFAELFSLCVAEHVRGQGIVAGCVICSRRNWPGVVCSSGRWR